jgi:hypothetical protein
MMNCKLLVILSLLAGSYTSYGQTECSASFSSESPFMISSATGQGNKIYENLRSLDNRRQKSAYIPNESIVKNLTTEGFKKSGKYQPIEILNLAPMRRERNMNYKPQVTRRNGRKIVRDYFSNMGPRNSGLDRAKEGEQHFIFDKSIVPAKDYAFVLRDKSYLSVGQDDGDLIVLKPSVNSNGLYKKDCEGRYFFNVVIKKATEDIKADPVLIDMKNQEGLDLVRQFIALPGSTAKTLIRIFQYIQMDTDFVDYTPGDLEYLHTLKTMKFPVDQTTQEAPFNSYYYNPDYVSNDDIFSRLISACTMLSILKTYDEKHGDGINGVALGDMMHPKSWKDHSSHGPGYCIDIRPVRNDGAYLSTRYGEAEYSRDKTTKLIRLLKQAGGSNIYFNDPKVQRELRYVKTVKGHNDHIHVCFDSTPRTRKACYEGL